MPHRHTKLHIGPIHSHVAGRTDHLPIHVPSGSYVVPADIVSAHGEGNTMAGFKIMRRMFGGTPYTGQDAPYGQDQGPYGQPLATGGMVNGARIHKNPSPRQLHHLVDRMQPERYMRGLVQGNDHYWWDGNKAIHADAARELGIPYNMGLGQRLEAYRTPSERMIIGGATQHLPKPFMEGHQQLEAEGESQGGAARDEGDDEGVPIVAAGGEYVLSPDEVRREGHGDLNLGHRVLDEYVKRMRRETVKTLQRLPGPKRD